jgi:hypothetical protein
MRHYDELARFERDGFEVVVDKTWEDLHPRDCFEVEDAERICVQVDEGSLDWFMLRVRVMFDGHEFGSSYLGGCCYEDAREVLTDGTMEDILYEAMKEAREEARRLVGALQRVIDTETV